MPGALAIANCRRSHMGVRSPIREVDHGCPMRVPGEETRNRHLPTQVPTRIGLRTLRFFPAGEKVALQHRMRGGLVPRMCSARLYEPNSCVPHDGRASTHAIAPYCRRDCMRGTPHPALAVLVSALSLKADLCPQRALSAGSGCGGESAITRPHERGCVTAENSVASRHKRTRRSRVKRGVYRIRRRAARRQPKERQI